MALKLNNNRLGNCISSTSLFHFTKKSSILKKILKTGLKYSFSCEFKPENFGTRENADNLVLPIICFCDTPIIRVEQHIVKYGKYGIGFDKAKLREKLKDSLNPVFYVSSSLYADALSKCYFISEKIKEDGLNEIVYNPIISLGPNQFVEGENLQKLIGLFYSLFKPCDDNNFNCNYYDEREWRAILPNNIKDGASWNYRSSNLQVEDEQGNASTISRELVKYMNRITEGASQFYINFSPIEILNIVNHIILPNEEIMRSYIKFIRSSKELFGTVDITDEVKDQLISRLNTIERIRKDY